MNPERDEQLRSIIADSVRRERCILFLGAGVHSAPPPGSDDVYPETHRPLTGDLLAKYLANMSAYPPDRERNLQQIALHFETWTHRYHLIDALRDCVDVGKEPSPLLRLLAKLPFPLIATTNYDRLFERALLENNKRPFIATYNKWGSSATQDYPGSDQPTAEQPFVFKIHGDIQEGESIVITDEDYIDFILRLSETGRRYPIPRTFQYSLGRLPALFLGYSLRDFNLRAFLKAIRFGIDSANVPAIFCVDRSPDPLLVDILQNRQRYVNFIAQDIWSFVPDLYNRCNPGTAAIS